MLYNSFFQLGEKPLLNNIDAFWFIFLDCNGMLCHAIATLEGCDLLWHIIAPPTPIHLSFCFFLSYFAPDLAKPAYLVGHLTARGVAKGWQ